jgi:CheY-like chemotaxis protein
VTAPEADPPRIAVVDDEPDFLKLVELWLRPAYRVESFVRSAGAVARLKAFAPDLVLLDVHMPEESGFSLCRKLRSEKGFENLPVVFLTGSKADEDFLQHLAAGGSRYLTKPIGRATLLEVLREQLGGLKAG